MTLQVLTAILAPRTDRREPCDTCHSPRELWAARVSQSAGGCANNVHALPRHLREPLGHPAPHCLWTPSVRSAAHTERGHNQAVLCLTHCSPPMPIQAKQLSRSDAAWVGRALDTGVCCATAAWMSSGVIRGVDLANLAHAICLLGRSKLRSKAAKTPSISPATPPKAMIRAFFGLTGASGLSAC